MTVDGSKFQKSRLLPEPTTDVLRINKVRDTVQSYCSFVGFTHASSEHSPIRVCRFAIVL